MLVIILSIFCILHGLVHLLYAGQSRRLFELRPGMLWPDGSWLFSRLLGDETTRLLAAILLALATLGFVASGMGLLIRQDWWRPMTAGAAVVSAATFLMFWNGRFQALADQGGIGLLINLVLVVLVLILRWPA